jgi:hypothetical protein
MTDSIRQPEKTSNSTEVPVQPPTKLAEEAIREHENTGGSTFDPRNGRNLAGTRNIAVNIAPEHSSVFDRPLTAHDHDNFVAMHHEIFAKHGHSAIGTHRDPETGLHHIEVVGLTSSKAAATDMAGHMGENHAYNLANDEKVPTGQPLSRRASHLSVDDRFAHLRAVSPKREAYSGTHFSSEKLEKIDGSRRGEPGAKKRPATDADNIRVRLGSKTGLGPDAPGGFYTVKAGAPAPPLASDKKYAHKVRGQFAFASTEHPAFKAGYQQGQQTALASGAPPLIAHGLGLNAGEKALEDAGFDGYTSPKHPALRFHFGDRDLQEPDASKPGR